MSNDYLSEFREQLTNHLLDASDIAPKQKSLEESYWDTITTTLPKETLAKNIFNDEAKLKTYMGLLKASRYYTLTCSHARGQTHTHTKHH